MNQARLAALIEQPEIHRRILRGYRGGYSLGLTKSSAEEKMAIRVRIEGSDSSCISSEIDLEGETIPVVVSTSFKLPDPSRDQ